MRLKWDQVGEKLYETGIDKGVIYKLDETGKYTNGEPWNGLTGVAQNPSGAEASPLYANNKKYLELMSAEEFGATAKAYVYPDAFAECDGSKEVAPGVFMSQQERVTFGMTYRTLVGNDTKGTKHGYKLHLVYGAKAAPSQKEYNTVNNDPNAIEFSWEITTTAVENKYGDPSAHIEIDSTKADPAKLKQLEDILYGKDPTTENGSDGVEPRLPLPDEVVELLKAAA